MGLREDVKEHDMHIKPKSCELKLLGKLLVHHVQYISLVLLRKHAYLFVHSFFLFNVLSYFSLVLCILCLTYIMSFQHGCYNIL